MIKVIAFDFGGVLYTWSYKKLIKDISKEININITKIAPKRKLIEKILERFERGEITKNEFWSECANLIDFSCDSNKLNKLHDLAINNFKPIKENLELVKILKKNFKIGLLSNQVDWIDDLEKKYNFKKLFDIIIISKEIGYRKPERQIFKIFDDVLPTLKCGVS